MSVKAINWVLYDTPRNLDAIEFRLLAIMGDAVDSNGRGAWKSVSTYAEEVGCSVRTIQSKLRNLEKRGLIMRGDQRIVNHIPANRRPTVYDLNLNADGTDTDTDEASGNWEETETEVQNMHPKNSAGVQTGVQKNDAGVQTGVNNGCTQTIREEPLIKPESRAHARETRQMKTLDDWMPNRESIALADELDADIAVEREKFRAKSQANGKRFIDIDAAFRSWLQTGAAEGWLTPKKTKRQSDNRIFVDTQAKHAHTWNCEHVLAIMQPVENQYDHTRDGKFGASEWLKACQRKAAELNEQEGTK